MSISHQRFYRFFYPIEEKAMREKKKEGAEKIDLIYGMTN